MRLLHAGLVYLGFNLLLNAALMETRSFDPTSLLAVRHLENRVLAAYFLARHLAWHDAWNDERHIPTLIDEVARSRGLDPALLQALVEVESSGRPHAVSAAGACGLTQVMPRTALELGVHDPFDPRENLTAGAVYLQRMLDRFGGSLPLALAAYNAGPGAVDAAQGIPAYGETRAYVDRVTRRLAALKARSGEP